MVIRDAFRKPVTAYFNENSFKYDYIDFERDEYNGRCYILEMSKCMRSDCDGKLVRKRISNVNYKEALKRCKQELRIEE